MTSPISIPGFDFEGLAHRADSRVVVRAAGSDGKPVMLKTLDTAFPDPRDVTRLRREFTIAQRLDLDGVLRPHELVEFEDNVAIVLPRFGRSLADWMASLERRPSAGRVLDIVIDAARVLGQVHEADIVHKDITPRNILFDGESIRLIDFGIASELPRERQDREMPRSLMGSLPYISPEQTGRMNRDLDYRSDYYSLGITLYELLTGRLPFQASSSLQWVHCHISQPPPPPSVFRETLSPDIDAVVLKLLAKDADDRYQSSYGLIRDLEACRDGRSFEPGADDVSRRFHIPQRLFGREAELSTLFEAFDRVSAGSTELVVVAGYSGVGKSALVRELARSIVGERGMLLEGKFDQFQQNTPYHGISQALRGLARHLLAEPESRLDELRATLAATLGANARLLTELVPTLEPVLGRPPPVVALPPIEAQNRLQLAFVDFLRVFTDRPVVLFLDDLQWSDGPTLRLLQRVTTGRDVGKLLVIGTYRDNQVDASHPLSLMLADVATKRSIDTIELRPLDREAVHRLVEATVGPAPQLADVLYGKAGGNPFFVTELLKRFYAIGCVTFDPEAGRWTWDAAAVDRAEVGGSVVEFLVDAMRRLPEEVQAVLQLAACIGNQFDLRTLSLIRGDDEGLQDALLVAMKRDLLAPLTDNYRYRASSSDGVWYRFQHDRIQQAAYALIPESERAAVHHRIGTLICELSSDEERDERLMEIVGHLNAGRAGITDPSARRELAEQNASAAAKARDAAAYDVAMDLCTVARELLPADPWSTEPALTMRVLRQVQECAYLTGDQEEAERLSAELERRAETDLQKAELLAVRTRQFSTRGKMAASIEAAIDGLVLLGVDFERSPDESDVSAELARVALNLGDRAIEDLLHAAPVTDHRDLLAIRLLMEIFPAAFLSGSGQLFPYLVVKAVNVTLARGNSPESAFAYAAFGMLLCGTLDDPALGLKYGQLAVRMNEELDDIGLKSRVIYVYAMFVHHWSHHWSTMTEWFERGIESGHQTGDLLYLAYSAQDCIIWDPQLDLETASDQQRRYLGIVKDTGYQDSFDSGSLFLAMQLNMQGQTAGPSSLDHDDFDEQAVLAGMHERGFMTGVANHHIYKAEIELLTGTDQAFQRALPHVEAMDGLIASAMSLPQLVRFHVVSFLVRASLLPRQSPSTQRAWRLMLEAGHAQLQRWARHCPENFEHLALLMQAELEVLDDRLHAALLSFETAADLAAERGWIRDAATLHERAARALLGAGLSRSAEGHNRAAHQLYQHWGARRKVRSMQEQYPELRTLLSGSASGTRTLTGLIDPVAIDLSSVMKASRTISGEDVLESIWATTLHVLAENAGAQRGCFVLRTPEGLVLQAVTGDHAGDAHYAESMVRAVLRSGHAEVLSDARATHPFQSDPHFADGAVRSVLVVPLSRPPRFEGAIYLENDMATGAFTEDRIEVLTLLSAQAVVATENAHVNALNVQLAEHSEHKSRHLADMSHELRTPLNAIIGYSELLGEEVRDAGMEEFVPDLERIEVSAKYLLRLINGVLDLSKIESGRLEVHLEPLALRGMIYEICTTLRPLARQNHNELTWEDGGLEVKADGLRVRQILTNLIGNAAKFTKNGTIEVLVRRQGPDVCIAVRDTGPGIEPEALATLFEPYKQASASTAASFGGTGLGLAIAKKLAELMDGQLTVESVLGEGSTFLLTLPGVEGR